MNFFNTANLSGIVDFAERSCARLLVHGHYGAPGDGIGKGRFASIEVPGDKGLGQGILDVGAGFVRVVKKSPDTLDD